MTRLLFLCTFFVGIATANPAITAIQSAASNVPAGLPNAGIARGSMFVIAGAELGPGTYVVTSGFPLGTSLGGSSVQIAVNGVTADGIMYYSGPQLAVILPSVIPAGEGTVTVTYNGATSPPFPITVVEHAFGIFTVAQNGSGDAIAFVGSELVTPNNAANTGDVVSFWGTGLSAVNFDETMAAQQFDMTDVPLEAYVGGRQANVLFRGRNACCSAVDVAYVEIPPNVEGCATPVIFKIGDVVSNATTIAVATSGDTCPPTHPALLAWEGFGDFSSATTLRNGGFTLQRSVSVSPAYTVGSVQIPSSTSRLDSIAGNFNEIQVPQGAAGFGDVFDIASYGACRVYSYRGQTAPAPAFTSLDAGDPVTVMGPPGNWSVPRELVANNFSYSLLLDQTGSTFTPGIYGIQGPGGADVGPFNVEVEVPPPLVWTNQPDILEVDRTLGVTLNWTGGDPDGYVQIQGYSFINLGGNNVVAVSFDCTARTTDRSFQLRPAVLLALPPTGTVNIGGMEIPNFGTLSVNSYTLKLFNASGLDYGAATHVLVNGNSVTYK